MDVEMGAGSREAAAVDERSAAAAGRAGPAGVPDPELVEQAKRRRFSVEYKLRVLREAEACSRPGEIGELLRREGLYTSHLTYWRKQRDEGALVALGRPRGRPGPNPLEAENARLRRRAERAEAELQETGFVTVMAYAFMKLNNWCAKDPPDPNYTQIAKPRKGDGGHGKLPVGGH